MTPGIRGEGRAARLADQRAATLLATAGEGAALVVGDAASFPCAPLGGVHVGPATDGSLSVADGRFPRVLAAGRPEEPTEQPVRVAELVRVCRPGGTIALVACAPAPAPPVSARLAAGSLPLLAGLLTDAGCDVVRTVPFDFLGPLSPWRLALRERTDRVLATHEEHLRFPLVRDAVRFLERRVVAALSPARAGRTLIVARRRDGRPVVPDPVTPLTDTLAAPAFRAAALRLAQDDAVLRWAAFVDAEILSPAGAPVDLVRWLAALGAGPPGVLHPGRWRWEGHELWRFLEAASLDLADRTIAALAAETTDADARALVPTLEYDLVHACNRLFERAIEERT